MKLRSTVSLLSAFAFVLLGSLLHAQLPPEAVYAKEPTSPLHVGNAFDEITIYQGIRQTLFFDVTDIRNPCQKMGVVEVGSKDCKIERKSKFGFYVQCFNPTGTLRLYYDLGDTAIAVRDIAIRCISADTNDPDFRRVFPPEMRAAQIVREDNFRPSLNRVVKDTNYVAFGGFAITQEFVRDVSTRVHVIYAEGCEPHPDISIEAKGVDIQKLDDWNEFIITPTTARRKATLQFFTMQYDRKVLLEEREFPILKPSE